jgi:hypothetical protein
MALAHGEGQLPDVVTLRHAHARNGRDALANPQAVTPGWRVPNTADASGFMPPAGP